MSDETPLLDEDDRRILREMQQDATRSLDRIGALTGLSKTTVWNRLQKMIASKVILRQAVIVDPRKLGLRETFFISIRTAHHDREWLDAFRAIVADMPQITEAHRLAGTLDYLLKVQVRSTEEFDSFYKDMVSRISIHDVSSSLSMEEMKRSLALEV